MKFDKGDRVWRRYDPGTRLRQDVGTVESVSPVGYVRVRWDEGGREWFRPDTHVLILVGGDDALPRHDWDLDLNIDNPPCRQCGIIQTDENEFASCPKGEMNG